MVNESRTTRAEAVAVARRRRQLLRAAAPEGKSDAWDDATGAVRVWADDLAALLREPSDDREALIARCSHDGAAVEVDDD
jgi:hypothetical protein